MQKSTIYCAIAGMLLLCGGCSKMKDDIDTLKKPIPTALVILNPEYIVQNGKTFDIPFRVNPSNFVVTKENLSLDVPASKHPFILRNLDSGIRTDRCTAAQGRTGRNDRRRVDRHGFDQIRSLLQLLADRVGTQI